MLHPREVPLGGPRAIRVRRTLPQRERSLIGAWCFADHYGPHDVRGRTGMDVPPHPHTGLQTVSWLFSGEIEHRDSAGVHAMVRPGELNLMTAGAGICHSEVSTAATTVLHGVQLWVALPDVRPRHRPRLRPLRSRSRVRGRRRRVRVFLGELVGDRSPGAHASRPLLGAQIDLEPAACTSALDVDPTSSTACCSTRAASRSRGTALEIARPLAYHGAGGAELVP